MRLLSPTKLLPCIALSVSLLCCTDAFSAEEKIPDEISFNVHIRPILSNHCFQCHGPDAKRRDADLRLDTREGAIEDRGDYAAVVPGKPDASALIERVTAGDDDIVMPPPDSKKPRLTERDVALLKKWIEQGAPYQGHWAFLPLAESAPPKAKEETDQQLNPIDAFVLEKLHDNHLAPSAPADRAILIRRLALDLTGLLPAPAEVTSFATDENPDAFERLADRLLADPHYGERWGRHWLDQARYADSNGYSIDGERAQWPFRDWVIRAFQQDMPFDQFTLEQLAGDLLPTPSKAQLVASAFHRNTLINQEGGTDAEQYRNEAVVDRVNTTGAVWLGLTIGCSQCHNHKYDPISQEEYYRLFAFFNQGEDVNNKGPTTTVLQGEMFGRPVSLNRVEYESQLAVRQEQWEAAERKRLAEQSAETANPNSSLEKEDEPVEWVAGKYERYESSSNAGLRLLDDQSILADGRGDTNDMYKVQLAASDLTKVAAVRLRVLPHESLPKTGPGLAGNGNFVLTAFECYLDGKPVNIASATADHEQPGYPVTAAIDELPNTGWAINVGSGQKGQKMNAPHEAIFVFDAPLDLAGKTLEVRLKHDLNERYLIGRFALDLSAARPQVKQQPSSPTNLVAALKTAANKRSAEQKKLLNDAFFKSDPQARQWQAALASEKKKLASLQAEVMIMRDRSSPRETFLQTRGDFLRPDKELGPLQPGVLSAVQQGFGEQAKPRSFTNRIELAKWLVDPHNPLTPRVTMNRMWLHFFGRGLVETEEDFGTQGTAPTHPELLDWLGREFIRGGWSLQRMQRLVVTSTTYRQSSHLRSDLAEIDPLNKLLGRQGRLRVEGEIVRDAALSAAGILARTIGGPSVHPPQPDGVYAFTQNRKSWNTPQNEERYRRGLYTFFYRSAPYPLLTTFDSPDFQSVCTRRARSNTPLQSLTLANDLAFVEIAQGLAERIAREVPLSTPDVEQARLKYGFALCLQRKPSERELSTLQSYYRSQQASFEKLPADAQALISPSLKERESSIATAAALVSVARVLLNTDAFITRE